MGKAPGGSSRLNAPPIYNKPTKEDTHGMTGWNYENMLNLYKQIENATNVKVRDDKYRGFKGKLQVQTVMTITDTFIEACQELGINVVDYNGKTRYGVSKLQYSTDHGKRCSATVFQSNRSPNNVKLITNAYVLEILIENKIAYGVKYVDVSKNKTYCLYNTKEVILAAGTIKSPQILMLSGIGPKYHLNKFGIKVKKNLPGVGQNYWDHMGMQLQGFLLYNFNIPNYTLEESMDMFVEGTGPLTIAKGDQDILYEKLNDGSIIEYISGYFVLPNISFDEWKTTRNFNEEIYDYLNVGINKTILRIRVNHVNPRSRGTVQLKSACPFDFPDIDPNYLSKACDVDAIVQGMRRSLDFINTNAFKKYGADITKNNCSCKNEKYGTDEYYQCLVRNLAYPMNRAGGTCKMGSKDDKFAVVDSRLKVHGIYNLRVADASVIPSLTGDTMATVYAIGLKLAHFIRDQYYSSSSDSDFNC